MMGRRTIGCLMAVMVVALLSSSARAQGGGFGGGPGGGPGGPGGPGGGPGGPFAGPNGQFDIGAFQTQMQTQMHANAMNNLRQKLGASDDEFAALQPLLEKVLSDQQAVSVGSAGGANGMQNMMQAGAAIGGRNGARAGGPNGPGAVGGPNAPGPNGGPNPMTVFTNLFSSPYGMPASDLQKQIQASLDALNEALADNTATPDSIREKIDTYRAAKTKAMEQLTKDQAALSAVLTAKQEGSLVAMGLLN